jgi:hypothetical protein
MGCLTIMAVEGYLELLSKTKGGNVKATVRSLFIRGAAVVAVLLTYAVGGIGTQVLSVVGLSTLATATTATPATAQWRRYRRYRRWRR